MKGATAAVRAGLAQIPKRDLERLLKAIDDGKKIHFDSDIWKSEEKSG